MVSIVISIHVIVCVAMCIIILLQQGKGAEVGAVFGGSSQTVFGASGAGNALTKATWAFAIIFFASLDFPGARVVAARDRQYFRRRPVFVGAGGHRDAGVEAGAQERGSRGACYGGSQSRRCSDAVVDKVVAVIFATAPERSDPRPRSGAVRMTRGWWNGRHASLRGWW